MKTILVVEDEKDIIELITYNLGKEGFTVISAATGEEGLQLVKRHKPDLVILDLMLPGLSGLDVCRDIKQTPATQHIPIIMVTARSEEIDIVTGLELGAEDYVPKPFSPKVLVARVKAVLRRCGTPAKDGADVVAIYELRLDPSKREVFISNKHVDMTFSEFQTLHLLARNSGHVFTRYQIMENMRGYDYVVTDRAIDVIIVGIRKKLGEYGRYIETVRGVGYRFAEAND
ncbi:response regulator transcription factor [Thermoproteota archaeon]